MFPSPSPIATPIATAMAITAQTDDSSPIANPESTVVAGPVRADSAISLTGARSVEVKCSVIIEAASDKITPVRTAQKTVMSWT